MGDSLDVGTHPPFSPLSLIRQAANGLRADTAIPWFMEMAWELIPGAHTSPSTRLTTAQRTLLCKWEDSRPTVGLHACPTDMAATDWALWSLTTWDMAMSLRNGIGIPLELI